MVCFSSLFEISISIVFDNDDSKQNVSSARGVYHSLMTTLDSQHAPPLQPTLAQGNSTLIKNDSNTKPGQKETQAEQPKTEQKQQTHVRKVSLNKSFDAFLQRTNDEWSDDLHEHKSTEAIVDRDAIEKASKAAEAVSNQLLTIVEKPPQLKKKKSSNPNGVKDDVQNLILGRM